MRAIGIVLAGGNSKRMRDLSNKRAIAAMPIAGSYRSIDFVLSNMSNSHVQPQEIVLDSATMGFSWKSVIRPSSLTPRTPYRVTSTLAGMVLHTMVVLL